MGLLGSEFYEMDFAGGDRTHVVMVAFVSFCGTLSLLVSTTR